MMRFVFDLDGTICFDGDSLPDPIREALTALEAAGHDLIFASARSYRDCLGILGEELSQRLVIGLNGGIAYEGGKLVYQEQLDHQSLELALAYCQTNDLAYFLDDAFDYACNRPEGVAFYPFVDPLGMAERKAVFELTEPTKLVIFFGDRPALAEPLMSQLNQLDRSATFYHEGENALYLNPKGVTKGATVERFCGRDFVAFGNDKNDMDFFDRATYAVQVGDYEPLTAYADQQVMAQPESVAQVIRDLGNRFKAY